MTPQESLDRAVEALAARTSAPELALLPGSGLAGLAQHMEGAATIAYRDIPGFPGGDGPEAGSLVVGTFGGRRVAIPTRRFQYCHGHSVHDIAFPLRAMARWGARTLIVTNAAGGINRAYGVGDIVAITDHIDFTGRNPLLGPAAAELGARFPDMSEIYSRRLVDLCLRVAAEQGVTVRTGVYIGVTGPSYETPAEIRAFRTLGADLVGMSTVPECIVARHMGQEVLAISIVTNPAAGNTPMTLHHEDVLRVAGSRADDVKRLLEAIVARL